MFKDECVSWSEFWNQVVSLAEQDGVKMEDVEQEKMSVFKMKIKTLWKKGVDSFDAYERLVDMFD